MLAVSSLLFSVFALYIPRYDGPHFTIPRYDGPHFTVPRYDGPHFYVPRYDGPHFTIPRVPPISSRSLRFSSLGLQSVHTI